MSGAKALSVRLESGSASVRLIRLVEVLYPFDRIGSFTCNDPNLNRIWQLAARSLEVLSEDAYLRSRLLSMWKPRSHFRFQLRQKPSIWTKPYNMAHAKERGWFSNCVRGNIMERSES